MNNTRSIPGVPSTTAPTRNASSVTASVPGTAGAAQLVRRGGATTAFPIR